MSEALEDALDPLEPWARDILQSLSPASRRQLFNKIGQELRKTNKKRMTAQVAPDGTPWEKRKPRDGRVKRKMLSGFKKHKYLKVTATDDGVSVGFEGPVARLARIHHEGLTDRLKGPKGRKGPPVKYPARPLIGYADEDRDLVSQLVLDHIQPEGT